MYYWPISTIATSFLVYSLLTGLAKFRNEAWFQFVTLDDGGFPFPFGGPGGGGPRAYYMVIVLKSVFTAQCSTF